MLANEKEGVTKIMEGKSEERKAKLATAMKRAKEKGTSLKREILRVERETKRQAAKQG